MSRLARKAVLILITFCFMAMVTEISLHLHVLSHKHPEEHDTEHCSVCQQLLVKPGKFITEPELNLPDSNLFKNGTVFQSQSYVIALHCKPFDPRPPPFA